MSDSEITTEHQTSEIFFEPVVSLPITTVSNSEENETCLLKERAKLYRFDRAEDPPEWKERGTGTVKILKHNETGQYRILMRRDRTLKVCANHSINSSTELRANCGSDRAFVWQTLADFADEVPKPESLGIRFPDAEGAKLFKKIFDEGRLQSSDDQDNEKEVCDSKDDVTNLRDKTCDESKLSNALKSLKVDPVNESGDQQRPAVAATN
ncbi:RAN binding protein 1 [Fasciola gigantica]|uniref:Ran-specific GTPase-activating protein n=1 Tax=Fasciola gigantica TaxID=46835 RepID=A0A504YHD6_FASGI|nr:RAN binding protein 1 [Fasciola gigantica]